MTLAMVPYCHLCDLDRAGCLVQAQVHEKPGQCRTLCMQLPRELYFLYLAGG